MFGHTENVSFWGWYPKDLFTTGAQMRWGQGDDFNDTKKWQGFQQNDRHNDSIC